MNPPSLKAVADKYSIGAGQAGQALRQTAQGRQEKYSWFWNGYL
jgi:cytochrome c551/c552